MQDWFEFPILLPVVGRAPDEDECEVELPASVVADYDAEREAALAALRSAEEKFRSYLDDNKIPYTAPW
jgi:hypothetical protein